MQNGDFEIIFGANRASNSGNANIGVWFFQQVVLPDGKGGFTGAHANGDVFIISAFTTGGVTSTISVYEWDSGCSAGVKNPTAGQCADTNLRLLASPTTGICSSSAYCGITNSAITNSTWAGNIAAQLFFEGGIDITAAFSGIAPVTNCFASFLVETRSSASTSSVLKDFIGGGFPVCSLSISKTCGTSSIVSGGTKINYPVTGVVTNTGIGTLYNVSAFDTDTVAGTTSSAILVTNNTQNSPNNGSHTLGSGETGAWSSSIQTSASSASDTAYAQGGLSASVIPDGTSTEASIVISSIFGPITCQNSVSSTLTVSKSCSTSLQAPSNSSGPVTVLVTYQGQVCNTGPSQVTGVILTDTPLHGASATITVGPLPACTAFDSNGVCTAPACVAYPASGSLTYTPTGIDQTVGGGTGPGRYGWTNDITITNATATLGSVSKITNTGTYCDGTYGCKSATCYICQSGQCTQ